MAEELWGLDPPPRDDQVNDAVGAAVAAFLRAYQPG
ncbi:TetR/AcrR family transcriptional regulator C-terminal domain-containing protein [Pseudomonas typographi]|uniref:Transcriptional regulator TetR C-terminal Proteobacteria type domain-containing protein n=1 Tax=Pseudomonas typographi TaxID=2715964 RepID=A0ABR7YZT0_9PSED|nr:hypothetical protein [Pseudomonas typographi]MBD1586842.1 hypothetical protein [Pseudomonas typographi]MBD1598736.1 hypothetical protein [Pseudomonas typographi]